jgi:hypothetical protein
MTACVRCGRSRTLPGKSLCGSCTHQGLTDEPIYCTCDRPTFNHVDECVCCHRPDLRAPRVAETFVRVATRMGIAP